MVPPCLRVLAAGAVLAWAASPAVLSAAPSGSEKDDKAVSPNEKLHADLDKVVSIDIQNQPLNLAVKLLGEKSGINFVLDSLTIQQQLGFQPENPPVPVNLKLSGVKVRSVLRTIVAQYGLAYAVIGDTVVITTEDMAMMRQMRQRVNVDFNKVEFTTALKQLSKETAVNLVLDGRHEKEASAKVSLQLEDVPLETAVRLLSEMAGLKAIRLNNTMFVTTKDVAAELRQDPDWTQPGQPGQPVPPPPGVFIPPAGGPVPPPTVIGNPAPTRAFRRPLATRRRTSRPPPPIRRPTTRSPTPIRRTATSKIHHKDTKDTKKRPKKTRIWVSDRHDLEPGFCLLCLSSLCPLCLCGESFPLCPGPRSSILFYTLTYRDFSPRVRCVAHPLRVPVDAPAPFRRGRCGPEKHRRHGAAHAGRRGQAAPPAAGLRDPARRLRAGHPQADQHGFRRPRPALGDANRRVPLPRQKDGKPRDRTPSKSSKTSAPTARPTRSRPSPTT